MLSWCPVLGRLVRQEAAAGGEERGKEHFEGGMLLGTGEPSLDHELHQLWKVK